MFKKILLIAGESAISVVVVGLLIFLIEQVDLGMIYLGPSVFTIGEQGIMLGVILYGSFIIPNILFGFIADYYNKFVIAIAESICDLGAFVLISILLQDLNIVTFTYDNLFVIYLMIFIGTFIINLTFIGTYKVI
jgi:hypothetical protein